MVFSSLTFLLIFLPLLLLIYFITPNIKYKNYVLLIFSLIFYAWGEPVYVFLFLIYILLTYILGLNINNVKDKNKKKFLTFSIVLLLLYIIFFKYFDFLLINVNNIFNIKIPVLNITMPIGISFYTFQAISYVIDVYNKKVEPQKNLLKLALYISLFPQLIAGPIVRYSTVEEEISNRIHSLDNFVSGMKRFIIGLSKKVILANSLALIADTIFDNNISGTLIIYIGAIAYMYQIYYDFSGYSDMAIGLGKIFGFTFLENFNYPYVSLSITEFWQRWHISLSSWFKDYVYIPLGGSRVKVIKHIRNMLIVWALTGLWHGASWNFIIWGLYYFALLVLEKYVFKNIITKVPKIIRYIVTMYLVLVGWVIFRIVDMNSLVTVIRSMFIYVPASLSEFILENANLTIYIILIIPAIIFSFPIFRNKKRNIILSTIINAFYIVLFVFNIAILVSGTYNPFIYFRF